MSQPDKEWKRWMAEQQKLEPLHSSDCAIYNEPAYPAGPCDCGATWQATMQLRWHSKGPPGFGLDSYRLEQKSICISGEDQGKERWEQVPFNPHPRRQAKEAER